MPFNRQQAEGAGLALILAMSGIGIGIIGWVLPKAPILPTFASTGVVSVVGCLLNVTAGTSKNLVTYGTNNNPRNFNTSYTPTKTGNTLIFVRFGTSYNNTGVQMTFYIRSRLWKATDNFGCGVTYSGLVARQWNTKIINSTGYNGVKTQQDSFDMAIPGGVSCNSNLAPCFQVGIRYMIFVTVSINNTPYSSDFQMKGTDDPISYISVLEV